MQQDLPRKLSRSRKKSHDTINAFKSLGTTLPIDAMSKRIHGPKSLQQAICDCFHVFNPSQFQLFVIFDTIEKGKKLDSLVKSLSYGLTTMTLQNK